MVREERLVKNRSQKNLINLIILTLLVIILVALLYIQKNKNGIGDNENNVLGAINTAIDEINKSSIEIPNLTEIEEQSLEVQETENEGFEEQGQIAYEGAEKNAIDSSW